MMVSNVGIAMSLAQPIFDGEHPTHQNGDEWGMVFLVYDIAIPTLREIIPKIMAELFR